MNSGAPRQMKSVRCGTFATEVSPSEPSWRLLRLRLAMTVCAGKQSAGVVELLAMTVSSGKKSAGAVELLAMADRCGAIAPLRLQ